MSCSSITATRGRNFARMMNPCTVLHWFYSFLKFSASWKLKKVALVAGLRDSGFHENIADGLEGSAPPGWHVEELCG